jgi:hypothetical protein
MQKDIRLDFLPRVISHSSLFHHPQKFCSCQVGEANRKFADKRKSQQHNRDLYSMDEGEKREELRRQKHLLDPLCFN